MNKFKNIFRDDLSLPQDISIKNKNEEKGKHVMDAPGAQEE